MEEPQISATTPEIGELVQVVVDAAVDRKAEGLRILELGEVTDFTDFFVISSGAVARQVQAIADGVEEALRRRKVRPRHVEGYESGIWVLLDYGDFIVHVFQGDRRDFYGLERLWADAPDVTEKFGGDSA